MKKNILLLAVFLMVLASCSTDKTGKSALVNYDAQIDTILPKLTLEEKIQMMHGKATFISAGVERLGIADMKYVDGPFGIREELQSVGWAPLGWETDKATFFPTGSALAATWSPDLAYAYGTAMAREARLRGKDMILGPAINIQRIPSGGRTYEYLSEDPFLSSMLSAQYTRGVQDNGVAACLKHYALNNQENNRGTVNVIIGERAMREIYLPPFEAAVREADAYGVMAAYNKVNGWWCAENDMLLNKILRDDWGFKGMVISDWYGTHSTVSAVMHGLNVQMPGNNYLGQALLDSVKAGIISEEIIDQRIREILRVRFAIKPIPEEEANKEITSQPEQQKIAYDVACKSIVLLKNEGALPLNIKNKPHIAVIGDNATRTMAQGGVGAGVKTLYEITPLEGLKNRIGDKAEITYLQGYVPVAPNFSRGFRRRSPEDIEKADRERALQNQSLNDEAVELAGKADIVLFFAGNNRFVETEARDRMNIQLPSGQNDLIRKIAEVNTNIITILVSGAPNDLTTIDPLSDAMLMSWFNGSEGGNALADVLLGTISPSGRLPFTLPVKLEDSPAYALGNYPQGREGGDVFVQGTEGETEANENITLNSDPNTAYYSEESLVGYRWFDTKNVAVLYPFGHGLTYTSFTYKDIDTDRDKYGKKDVIELTFNLVNTGKVQAEEVVQGYVHRINSTVEWPEKELKVFSRIPVEPGETKVVTLEIPVRSLYYWDEELSDWNYDPCDIEIRIGASAGDIRLSKKFSLK
ncbi:glycoside hydrolase family 3 C-terminal domain-containing protein [Bacteroidota bacterium]